MTNTIYGSEFPVHAEDGTHIADVAVTTDGMVCIQFKVGPNKDQAQVINYTALVQHYYNMHVDQSVTPIDADLPINPDSMLHGIGPKKNLH